MSIFINLRLNPGPAFLTFCLIERVECSRRCPIKIYEPSHFFIWLSHNMSYQSRSCVFVHFQYFSKNKQKFYLNLSQCLGMWEHGSFLPRIRFTSLTKVSLNVQAFIKCIKNTTIEHFCEVFKLFYNFFLSLRIDHWSWFDVIF